MLQFGTKAETLERLRHHVTRAQILPAHAFTVTQWQADASGLCDHILQQPWGQKPLAVRSSATTEDAAEQSCAGQFTSVLHVNGKEALQDAIQRVIASYSEAHGDDQVLVQPMVQDVAASGVAFGVEPSSGGSYLVINYDDTSGSTESVTSGGEWDQKICYHSRFSPKPLPAPLDLVADLVAELESLFGIPHLDVEFAITKTNAIYLLQVRQLVNVKENSLSEDAQRTALENIEHQIAQMSRPHPYLYGKRGLFGVMPDWNPAEIIGVRPRPLAMSLYRELVTDNIWAYQRNNYGYKNLRSFPLLMSFGGLPYVDVRVSFNSFIPRTIHDELAEKLVNHYLDKLAQAPEHHDKVEFDVVHTAYTFDLPERIQSLKEYGFSSEECEEVLHGLRELTNRIIHPESGLWQSDAERISVLKKRLDTMMHSDLDHVQRIYWLLEDCKRYGTLPFAGLARAGFIAALMLRSLVSVGVLSKDEQSAFMATLDSVSSRMRHDFSVLSKRAFLEEYGHLRPGTYDILSPRYDEEPDRYFDWTRSEPSSAKHPTFTLSLKQLKDIEALLKQHSLDFDVLGLFDFMKAAMEGREYAKFVFTKSLSEAISLFGELGAQHGFSKDDCSYANVEMIKELYVSSRDPKDAFASSIKEGQSRYQVTKQLTMPALIVEPSDVWSFTCPASEPSFVTQQTAMGRSSAIGESPEQLKGTILFIPNADPGFDWIFSCDIAGFVTKYGGVNSHMAIRAGELEIPAVIGAGEVLYNEWAKAQMLQLDCVNRQVQVLR